MLRSFFNGSGFFRRYGRTAFRLLLCRHLRVALHLLFHFLRHNARRIDLRFHFLRRRRNERRALRVFGDHVIVLIALQHRRFGVAVKKVNVHCVECEFYDLAEFHGRTGRNLGDHLRNAVNDGILVAFVIDVAVDLRFRTEFFDNFDFRFHDRIGRLRDERLVLMNIFGTDAERHRLARVCIFFKIFNALYDCLGKEDLVSAYDVDVNLSVLVGNRGILKEVHLRSSDKSCNEQVDRVIVKVLRSIDLLHETVFHNDDTGPHRHSLDLIVRNVNKRGRKANVEFGNFRTHLCAELRVQVGKRLVEKEYFGFADDRTAERHALTLTARKSLRLTGQVISDTENIRRRLDLFVDNVFGNFSEF